MELKKLSSIVTEGLNKQMNKVLKPNIMEILVKVGYDYYYKKEMGDIFTNLQNGYMDFLYAIEEIDELLKDDEALVIDLEGLVANAYDAIKKVETSLNEMMEYYTTK